MRETFTDEVRCTIPSHFHKFLLSAREPFSAESLVDKVIFIEDDFLMLELDRTTEIVFHVPSQRVLSSFNTLNPHFHFNEVFMPAQWLIQMTAGPAALANPSRTGLEATQAQTPGLP